MRKLWVLLIAITLIISITLGSNTNVFALNHVDANANSVTYMSGVSANSVIYMGDANQDGVITMADVTKVERIILWLDSPTDTADANNDGSINMADVTRIERIILQLASPIPNVTPAIQNTSIYFDILGDLNIVGEVINNFTTTNIQYVEIVGTFYNSQAQVIDTDFTFTSLDIIKPGQKSPFRIYTSLKTTPASYKLTIQWSETAQQPSSSGLNILTTSNYVDSLSYYHVVGEVISNLTANLKYAEIVGTFYDSLGKVIDTDFTFTSLDIIKPGQKSPFELITSRNITPASFRLYVQYTETTQQPFSGLNILSQTPSYDTFGYYTIMGEVKNQALTKPDFVELICTFYDSTNKVIGYDYTFTNPSTINPGDTAPFKISSYPRILAPDHFTLQVQGSND